MPENKCTAQYIRETQIFWEMVHVDGEREYKHMISKIKEIACEFSDDVEKACIPRSVKIHHQEDRSAPEGEHFSMTPCADKV